MSNSKRTIGADLESPFLDEQIAGTDPSSEATDQLESADDEATFNEEEQAASDEVASLEETDAAEGAETETVEEAERYADSEDEEPGVSEACEEEQEGSDEGAEAEWEDLEDTADEATEFEPETQESESSRWEAAFALESPFVEAEVLTRGSEAEPADRERHDEWGDRAQEADRWDAEAFDAPSADQEPQTDAEDAITDEEWEDGQTWEFDPASPSEGWAAEDAETVEDWELEAWPDEATPVEAEAADTTLANDRIHVDPAYITNTGDKAPEIWAYSDKIRKLLDAKGDPPATARLDLGTALKRQLSTLLLHRAVARLIAALKEKDKDKALTLYVIVFPGEARDNTGIKDLNDKVLGPEINNRYILRRQTKINELYGVPGDDAFVVVGQDYKTASVLTIKTGREEFARRLAKLDATLRRILLDEILPEAEKDALARNDTERQKEIRKLRDTLRKNEKYKFDIFFGVAALNPLASRYSTLQTVYLLVTEALKAAGVAKLIAKGSAVTTKVARGFTKGIKPDAKSLDPRGKQFDSKTYLLASTKAGDIKALMTRKPSRDKPDDYYNILVDTVWTVAFLKYRRWFVGHPDVIRDVRKKALQQPGKEYGLKYKRWFTAQKEMLELWLVVLNVIDYVKDFLSGEFRTALARYHQDALTAYSNVLDPPMGAIDWPRLERVLTHDVRQTKRIAVLGTASEFQFYSYAADYRERIFFMMDIRDLGVVLALFYDDTTEDIEHRKLTGVNLMKETFKSTDWINLRKRFTYDRVVEAFRQHYDVVSKRRGLLVERRGGKVSLGATVRQVLPRFEQSIQVMVGGDEVFVAADPFYAGVAHRIISDLAKTPLGEGTLNMRAAVAFSRAEGDPPKRDNVQAAHARAMMLAGLAPGTLKRLERTQRRIERLILKLEANPKKKDSAPKFRSELGSLGLMRLFARAAHGRSMQLTPQRFARLFRLLTAADLVGAEKTGDFEIVDFNGKVVNAEKLEADAARLEDAIRKKVGVDNIHIDPPPVTQIPKWIQELLDWIFKDEDEKKQASTR